MLLVGGWAMTKNDWGNEFIDSLQTHRPVITFDHRGMGQSDCPPGPYTTDMLADDCIAVIQYVIPCFSLFLVFLLRIVDYERSATFVLHVAIETLVSKAQSC